MLEHLSESERAYILKQVEEGLFKDPWEALNDAVRRSREETEQEEHFRALVTEGEASIARGGVIPYTPELMDDIFKRAMEHSKNGKPVKDAIKP